MEGFKSVFGVKSVPVVFAAKSSQCTKASTMKSSGKLDEGPGVLTLHLLETKLLLTIDL